MCTRQTHMEESRSHGVWTEESIQRHNLNVFFKRVLVSVDRMNLRWDFAKRLANWSKFWATFHGVICVCLCAASNRTWLILSGAIKVVVLYNLLFFWKYPWFEAYFLKCPRGSMIYKIMLVVSIWDSCWKVVQLENYCGDNSSTVLNSLT